MSVLEAVQQVLAGAQKPLHYQEITKQMVAAD
jgi:hypothetical protein